MTALEKRSASSLALLYSFRMLGLFMVLPLLALYGAEIPGATPALIGLALGIYGLSQALLQIPFGWLSDHIGRKPVIVGGLVLFALGSLVAANAQSIEGLIFGRLLQGSGAIAGSLMALLADLTRDEQRTKAMAIVGMSIGLSFAVALILGPVVAAAGGLTAVFYFTAVLAVVGIVIVVLLVPSPKNRRPDDGEVGARLSLVGRSLSDTRLLRLNFGVFTLHFILMACFLMVPGILEAVVGIHRDEHWQVYLPTLLFSVLGMLPLMRLAERGNRPRQMYICAIALVLVGVSMATYMQITWSVYFGLWLFFVGFNYLEATLPSLVSKSVFSGGRGTAMGMFSSCQFLGAFVGGAVGGWLLQTLGDTALIAACVSLLAIWLLITLPPSQASLFKAVRVPDA